MDYFTSLYGQFKIATALLEFVNFVIVKLSNIHAWWNLTTKPEVSVALFVPFTDRNLAVGTKLGRKVRVGHRKKLAGPVSMATIMLSWQPKKSVFMARSGLCLDIRLPVMSQSMMSHRQ